MAKRTKEQVEKNTRAWEKAHPGEFKAKRKTRSKVNNAVRDGRMKKPAKCPRCGGTTRIEYDHHSKPPGWGCSKCNKRGGAAR